MASCPSVIHLKLNALLIVTWGERGQTHTLRIAPDKLSAKGRWFVEDVLARSVSNTTGLSARNHLFDNAPLNLMSYFTNNVGALRLID